MEFLVEFDVRVPDGTSASEVQARFDAEASAAAALANDGVLIRLWKPPTAPGETKAIGLYRAASERHLDDLLRALPLSDWLHVAVTPLAPHPNDPYPPPDPRGT